MKIMPPERLDMDGSNEEEVEVITLHPDEVVETSEAECDELFAEFEFPPLVRGKK